MDIMPNGLLLMESADEDPKVAILGERQFQCELCSKRYKGKRNLRAHVRNVHLDLKAHPCPLCGQIFVDSIVLQHHILNHTGKPAHECDICHKLFSRKTTLKIHMRLHTKDEKYECPECGKTNGTKFDLQCHMRTHTGERPFQCHICDPIKAFGTRSSLMRHVRTHSGYQPHSCKTCKKTFSRKDQYHRHIKRHLAIHCQGCDKFFSNYEKYVEHQPSCPDASYEPDSQPEDDEIDQFSCLNDPGITLGQSQMGQSDLFSRADISHVEGQRNDAVVDSKIQSISVAIVQDDETENEVLNVIIENDELDHRKKDDCASDDDSLPRVEEGKSLIIVEQ